VTDTTWTVSGDVPFVNPFGEDVRLPERTIEDALRSVRKHLAEVLVEVGGRWLQTGDAGWEVRYWDDRGTFELPFARVSAIGPDTVTGPPMYAEVSQPMTIHLYPHPAEDTEHAILQADRLRGVIQTALHFGAARGRALRIPLWDFGEATGLYDDSEARRSSDYLKVVGLGTERLIDPEDDRYAWVVVNFRAQWRRVPSGVPGLLVESVRMSAHPR
jgi:hypothetical protein